MSSSQRPAPAMIAAIREWMWLWDPAGLSGVRDDIPDEYDDLASGLAWRVSGALGAHHAIDWLQNELAENWGVPRALSTEERENLLRLLATE